MRIIVTGLGKTGTTALFFKMKEAMPADTSCLFEVPRFEPPAGPAPHVLVKTLFGSQRAMDVDSFQTFDRKILLLRDPRDTLVSRVLYDIYNEAAIWSDDARVSAFIGLLRRKEKRPQLVSLCDLIDVFDGMARRAVLPRATADPSAALDFQRRHPEYFAYRYEDLIRSDFASLETYLGFDVGPGPAIVPAEFERVARHKSAGDWRHWLTSSDVAFFRPYFAEYLAANGYDDDWTLADQPRIAPDHSSAYVLKLVAERRRSAASA